MGTEDDTVRMLKRTPFSEIFVKFMFTDIPVEDRHSYIESHGWSVPEFLCEYHKRTNQR